MIGKEYWQLSQELEELKRFIEERERKLRTAVRRLDDLEKALETGFDDKGESARNQKALRQDGTVEVFTTHRVTGGDSLSSVAAQYYGSAKDWKIIYEANIDIIGAYPNVIRPGQVLRIPRLG
jgi:nucleoid-associated protein YgaU